MPLPPPTHRAELRSRLEALLERSRHLARPDRTLVEAVLRDGRSPAALAAAAGVPRHRLARRLRAVLRHLQSPAFSALIAHHDLLPRDVRSTAAAVVFRRRSLRHAARATGRSLHTVRQHMAAFRSLARI